MSLGMTEPVSAECQEEEAPPTPMASPGSSPTSLPPISHRSASSATRDVEVFLKKSAIAYRQNLVHFLEFRCMQ